MSRIQFLSSSDEFVPAGGVPVINDVVVRCTSSTAAKPRPAIIDTASTVSSIPADILKEVEAKPELHKISEPTIDGVKRLNFGTFFRVHLKVCDHSEREILAEGSTDDYVRLGRDILRDADLTISWSEPDLPEKSIIRFR